MPRAEWSLFSDPSCNPICAAMLAGTDGTDGNTLVPGCGFKPYDAEPGVLEKNARAAENLEEAVLLARRSAFVQRVLPAKTLANYRDVKLEGLEAEDRTLRGPDL